MLCIVRIRCKFGHTRIWRVVMTYMFMLTVGTRQLTYIHVVLHYIFINNNFKKLFSQLKILHVSW